MNTVWNINWYGEDGSFMGATTRKDTESNALCHAARLLCGGAVYRVVLGDGDKLFTLRKEP